MQTLWQNDPIVRLEKALIPVVQSVCFDAITSLSSGTGQTTERTKALLQTAIQEIGDVQTGPMARMNIALDAGEREVADQLTTALRVLLREVPSILEPHDAQILAAKMKAEISPLIDKTLDTFRHRFIDTVIHRQMQSDAAAEKAQQEIEMISRKIFFVSLNASVEASRFGEEGSAFAVISTEIRNLAQQAQASLRKLLSA